MCTCNGILGDSVDVVIIIIKNKIKMAREEDAWTIAT
jgi:hypothetical protein